MLTVRVAVFVAPGFFSWCLFPACLTGVTPWIKDAARSRMRLARCLSGVFRFPFFLQFPRSQAPVPCAPFLVLVGPR